MGKNGALTTSTSFIFNDYTPLTVDATIGATTINVVSSLLNARITTPLAAGDLIFIIQIQGATMTVADDTTYGGLISYNNCGNYEFAEVTAVPSATQISISCQLKNNYSVSGKTQIVRVPRLTTLTIGSGGSITCPAWNGSTGGVLILEVMNGITINSGGLINASGKGFRAGQNASDNNTAYGVLNYVHPTDDYGAEKGEGIGGSQSDYDLISGRFCKGAPLNGGGGANGHNAGGGGGGNCGLLGWTGRGVPDISTASWANAWNLEYSGFASSVSSGGGKGGYTFSGSNQNALTVGTLNAAWGGDQRRENGGRGGRPLDYSTGRIFMGGGGGAGDQNNSYGGAGGNGGGIIYLLCYNTISGSGSVNANGDYGVSTVGAGTDGAGGAGAGGTIFLDATGLISGITANANGGNGGNQVVGAFINEAEGPGGGGGGGYIASSSGAFTRNANGGLNGTTNSSGLAEFPSNGATKGGVGLPSQPTNTFHIVTSTVYICPGTSTTLSFSTTGIVPPGTTFTWYDQAVGGTQIGSGTTFNSPVLSSGQITYYVSSCPGAARFPVQVQVSQVTATASATTVCSGIATDFTGTGTSSTGTISTWSWNFGNGSGTSLLQNPSYIYSTANTYTVTLTVTDNSGCTASTTQSVIVNATPTINFSTPTTSGCLPLNVSFTNTTTSASTYSWNFGDGSPLSSSTTPSHNYTTAGIYSVTLTASNTGCTATSTQTNLITVRAVPHSSFSSPSTLCLGDIASFANLSTPNGSTITGYSWNFGDASALSTGTNPTHTYLSAGTFNIVLTTSSAFCFDDTTIAITISPAPTVNFSTTTTSGCTPMTITFNNTTSGTPVYSWSFGDGSPLSTTTTPTHIYSNPGNYTVTLIASIGSCRDTLIRTNYISVYPQPTSSFSTASVCLGDSVHFINLSIGNGGTLTSYTWNYGDGTTSTATLPHLYFSPGSYNVLLTASTANCSDDTTITVTVSPAPVVNFNTANGSGCGSLTTTFVNSTTGSPSYIWNFGDGSAFSSVLNPTHTYSTSGIYSVTLIATQGTCADTLVKTNYITVYDSPISSFTTSDVCIGDSVHFTNLSNGNGEPITNYTWNYGDGNFSSQTSPAHYYTSAGTYNVLLSIITTHCVDDTTISVMVSAGPIVSFTPSATTICGNQNVVFTNTTTGSPIYSWDFGDGSASSAIVNPTHYYAATGTYSVSLIATQGSCADTLIQNSLITVYASPLSSFSTDNVCLYDSVHFLNESVISGGVITSYSWNFGDGTTSSADSPVHYYSSAGTYSVNLIAASANCSDDTTITVTVNPNPVVNFISTTIRACDSATVFFNNTSTGATAYSWNFGDGGVSTSISPTHFYSSAGVYNVLLTASSVNGCSSSKYVSSMVIIKSTPLPLISASRTSVCPGECISYTDLTTGTNTSWQWQFSGGNPASSISRNPSSVCYNTIGNYSVTLTVSNGSCTASHTETSLIHVVNCSTKPRANFVSSDTNLCGGSCISFVDLSLNAVSWQWQFPGATPTSSTQEFPNSICYSTTGVYPVTLIAGNTTGYDTFTVSTFIHVTSLPSQPTFTQSGNLLIATSANTYQWFYNNIPISGATNQQYTATLSGPYSVQITDANGCSSTSLISHVSLVGIDDFSSSMNFEIYPNPTTGEVFIKSDKTSIGIIHIDIIDLLGRTLLTKSEKNNFVGSIWKIDISNLAQGMYFIRFRNQYQEWKTSIIKE